MAATSPLVRLRRLALPLALVALCAAAAHGQTLTSAVLTASNTIAATLSNATTSADCRAAFVYLDSNNATKAAAPFANCTVNGTTSVTLILASGVSYAAGDQLNVKVNQTTLNTTAGAPFIPAAAAVAVQPVLGAATLTGASTLVVKLPLSSGNTMPDGYATNMTICGAAVQLLSAAGVAKSSPFSACLLAADTLTLTLTSSGTYAPGDVVNVVAGQSTLKNGATSYTKSAAGSVIRPTLTTVSLATTTTILIGATAPVSLPANASADVCNAVFTVALKNGTALPTALSACVVGPAATAITATFANGTTYSDGLTVTIKANQTVLRTGDQSAASPLFLPPAAALVIAPTVLSASLTSATSITVQLPVASTASGTLDAAGCNGAFELRSAGSSTSKSSPFSACALASNNTALVLTLASASTYTAGDVFNVKSGQSLLQVGSTAYVPQSVTVLPTITSATLVSSSVVRVALPVVSSIPAPYSADDCARSIIVAAANSTVAKAISACALSADGKALLVTLGAAYAAGDTVNVRTGQWQLRAGVSVTLGPNYIANTAAVAIVPGFNSAVLTSATQVTVQLPLASSLPATISAAECGDAFDLVDATATTSRTGPWTGCAIGSNNTLVLNMTVGIYVVGDQVTPKSGQTKLMFANTTAYGVLLTPINPTLTAATTAMLTASTTIVVALPYAANLPASTNNGTVCNAAFDLVSAAGASRTAPFSACSISGGSTLTLTIAASASYTAGDRINVKSGNNGFLGSLSASGPAFVRAAAAITITPTVVSTAMISNTNVFVSLSAPTSASAFNQSICNGAFDVSGLTTPFTNCTLSADGTGINFLLASAGSVTSGVTTINVKSGQLLLLAAGSGSSDSPAFVPRGSALAITEAKLVGAYLTAANTIIAKLSVAAAAVDGFASSCNNVFTLSNATGSARASPFTACTLSTDGLTVTLTTTAWVTLDKLNIRSDQTLLKVLGAANGPNYPALSAATEVSPAITSAQITSPTTIIVPLPVASDLTGSSCGFLVLTAATSSCALSNNGTLLTVTLSGAYTIGDTINMNALNSALRGTSSTGALYQPISGATAATIQPTIGAVQVTTSTRLLVTLPAAMDSPVPNPLTADACNSALDLSGKSSPFAACSASGTTLTLDLASAFVPGDRLNVKSTNTALRLGSGASALLFQPLATSPANILNPTFVSAKATSTSVVVVTLPAASTFVKSGSATAGVVKADCDTVLAMSSGSLVAAGNACDLNTTSSSSLIVTLGGTTYAPGQTINVLTSNTMLLAGSATGPAYQARTITISPAYLSSDVVATAPDTIVVTLPVTSSLYDTSGNSLGSSLTAAQCATVLEVKAGTTAKGLNSCSLSGSTLTVKLLGNNSDVYTGGDTFNFKDSNALLLAGSANTAPAYKALPTAATIVPNLYKAVASAGDTILVTLPAASTFVVSGSATLSVSDTVCNTILTFTNSKTVKSGTNCVITGSVLNLTLNSAITDQTTVTINSGGQTTLVSGTGTTGPAYKAGTAVPISPAYLTSAAARSATSIEVTLPFTSNIGGSSTPSNPSKATCDTIVEVLNGGDATKPRTLASATPCTLATALLTVNLASTESFAPGDTVRIKSGNTVLLIGTAAGNAPYAQAASATPIALGYVTSSVATKDKEIKVTFPVPITLVKAGASVTTLDKTDCDTLLTVASGTLNATGSCTLSGSVLTIGTTTSYAPATTTVQFTAVAASASVKILGGTGTTGTIIAALSAANAVLPGYLTSAVISGANTFTLTLPYAVTSGGTPACSSIIEIKAANGTAKTFNGACSVASTTTVTGTTDLPLLASDTVTLKGAQSALTTTSGSKIYAATTAINLQPAYLTGAYAIDDKKFVVVLPYASTLGAGTCSSIVSVTDNNAASAESGCTLALDGTGIYLTVTVSASLSAAPAAWKVDFKAAQTALTVGTTAWAPMATGTAKSLNAGATTWSGSIMTATAVATNVLEVTLPMTSYMADISSGCSPVTFSTANTAASCKLIGTSSSPTSILQITLTAGYVAGAVSLANAAGLIKAGSSSGTAIGAANSVTIKPTFVSAVATGPQTIVVSLPIQSKIIKGAPTCTGGTVSCTSSGTATCQSGTPACSAGAYTCTASSGPTCAAPTISCPAGTTSACITGGAGGTINAAPACATVSSNNGAAVCGTATDAPVCYSAARTTAARCTDPSTFSAVNLANCDDNTASPPIDLSFTCYTSNSATTSDVTAAGVCTGSTSTATPTCNAAGAFACVSATAPTCVAASPACGAGFAATCATSGTASCGTAGLATLSGCTGAYQCTKDTTGDTCDDDVAAPTDCSKIFSLTGGTATIAGCTNPGSDSTAPYTTTVTLATANWLPGTTLSVASDQATAAATNYLKPTGAITLLYTTKPSGAVVIYPSITSATLTGPKSLQVSLPVAASVPSAGLSATDCNNIFQLYATGSSTPKTAAVFTACYLGADKQTFYLTLAAAASSTANANTYAVKDLINIKSGQSLLKADSTTAANRLAFAPLPDNLLIRPAITSAVATTIASAAVIKMQLPLTSTLGSADCTTSGIKVRVNDATDKTQAGTGACTISSDANGAVLTLTLNQALTASDFTTGKGVAVVVVATSSSTAGQLQLFGGSDNTGPLYVTGTIPLYDVVTPGQSIVSAKAIAANQVEIKLPAPSTITTGNTCANFLAFTPSRTISSCSYDADTQLVTATVDQFAAGDAVNIAGAPNLLKYATAAATLTGYAALASAATVSPAFVSAYTVDSTTIAVVLPATSSLYDGTSNTALKVASLTDTECADVLTVLVAGKTNSAGASACATPSNCRTLFSGAACLLGTTSAGDTTLTVKLGASYAAGDTVDVWDKNAGLNGVAAASKPLRVGSNVQPLYVPRRMPVVIEPRIVSATATGARTIALTLPVTSQLIDSTGAVVTSPTQQQCASIVALPAGKSVASCAISTDFLTLTVTLAADFAPGDTVNIASGQGILRAWKSDVGPGYELSGPLYTPSASAVTVTLSFFVSGTATSSSTVVVTLPFPVKMYDLTASPAEIVFADGTTPTKDNCDSVIRVIPSGSTTARTLATPATGVAPCVVSGTTITLTLATGSYVTGDRIDVGFGNSANLRAAATAAAVVNTSPKYTTVATLNGAASAAVATIGPSIVSAAAASPTQIKVTLSASGTITTTPATVDDCNKIVTFTPAKTLAATSPCSVSGTTLTVNLDTATPYVGNDAVNIAAANSLSATTNPLKAGTLAFVAKAAAVTIDPNLYTATAIDSLAYEIKLPAASSVGATALTAAQCSAILSLTGGRTISTTATAPCLLDSTKTLLTVSLGTAYADGDTVTLQGTQATPWLRAASDTGPAYKVGTTLAVKPTIASAKATTATNIEVTLPVTSVIWSTSGSAAVSTTLTAADCAKILAIKRASSNVTLAGCSLSSAGATTLTVTLASDQAFQAGDKINILSSNADTANTDKYLVATTSSSGQPYIARSSDVTIAPGYINAAYAIGPNTLSVALPVVSSIADSNDCSTVVTVRASATPTTTRTVSGACSVTSDATGYYLIVTLAPATPFVSGDEVLIKSGNTALVGNVAYASGATGATKPIYANFDDAILSAPTTVLVTMAAVTTVSFTSKADCDAVFVFTGAGNTTKTTSPISSCALASDGMSVTITLTSADAYAPGDAVNVVKDQTAAKVGGSSGTNLVPYPTATTISPRAFGAKATLVAPTSVAFSLPAVSSLPATAAAADCNSAMRYTDVSGVDAVNPFTSCALTPDTKGIALNTASPIYKAGDVMNVKWTNAALRWGPQASGAAYYPADADVPVFATIATAVLVDPSTVILNLPAVSAIPDNFTVPDCLRAIEFKTAAGVVKNGTVASCVLLPDRLGLQVKLLSAGNFSAGDTVNIKPQQAELRSSALATGPSYVPKLAAQVVNPALFANANLTSATAITVRLPFASALAAGTDCKTVLALLSAAGVAKNVSSCSLGTDGVTLAVTIPASSFVGGDVLNIVPGQRALTLADGTTAYVPSKAGVLVTPNIVSAALTNATIITVALPTASVLISTAAADCSAAVVIASNGSAVASPLSACAVSADGLTLTLTAATTYKPMAGDTVDVAVNQTVLRAGSATGPAYVPRPAPALITVPSPPPSPPPSPAPSPPPSPPLSTANYSARGLATGPLSCNVLIGANTITTTSGNFTGLPSYAGKDASFRGSCKDAVTGAVYTDDTVASTLPAGLTGLVLAPVTALASVWDISSVADLADTNKDYLRLLGVPVNASAYGSATALLAYDYYVKGFVALETPAVAVMNVEGMVAANLLMYTKFFDGLNSSVAGRDISAAEALAAGQYALAMGLEMATTPVNSSDPAAILQLLNSTYSILTAKNATAAAGRRLLQTAASFTQLQAQAAALAAATADSNALVAVQQAKLIAAINAGTSISAADLTNIINEASKVIVTQSTVIANAATGLASGAISPASFTSSYTGSALTTLVAQQQLAATPGSDVTASPPPAPPSEDSKSNTALIIGLVVGLVGGAIVITLIVVFIVMRRRKQNVAAAGQATA
ncbi:hypothetical protein HXX76_011631 [Chlamydomonas incerta]|uniref:Uncharacterized protein n=1 Tax=Chlamydomonas incerta TaxID=51695 RepID=A0A835SK58_CHLIN|nr:hypothetical protein HXX76_011631 [Chlamydomonas incerta]|eukprot:KAG2428514.1 hypothetical protein HXX76_011631 [Chlamydomonas incerta]